MTQKQRIKKNLNKYWEDLADSGYGPAVFRKMMRLMPPRFHDTDLWMSSLHDKKVSEYLKDHAG